MRGTHLCWASTCQWELHCVFTTEYFGHACHLLLFYLMLNSFSVLAQGTFHPILSQANRNQHLRILPADVTDATSYNAAGSASISITLSGLSFTSTEDPTPTIIIGNDRTCLTTGWASATSVLCLSTLTHFLVGANYLLIHPWFTVCSSRAQSSFVV